jgi:stage II sporulation protein AA (anti-sigma F factor antagonist)
MSNNMQIYFKLITRTLIISIIGEIDHHTSEEARNRIDNYIDSNSVKNVIFDFSDVSFMDSAGIGVIIGRYKRVSIMGGKVSVVTTRPQIKRILEISGIQRISCIYDSIDNALLNM